MSWYVLYTRPRTEKKVAEGLEKMGLEVYCPHKTEVRQWSDRKKKVSVPLFKSYVFVNLAPKDRNVVFDVPGVVFYLFWLGKPAIVRDEEIEVIKKWLNNDEVDEIEVAKFSPGDEVTIAKGAFKDQKAVIREIGRNRMKLILPSLGCTVNVKIKEVI